MIFSHFHKITFTVSIALAMVAYPVFGQETALISRTEAIQTGLQNNRQLAIAELEIDRAKSTARWSGRLDNPELEISNLNDGIGLDDNENTFEIGFSQNFPLTSKLKDEKDLRRIQVLLAEAEIADRKRKLAAKIDRAFVQAIATAEKSQLNAELVTLNGEITTFLEAQVKRGEVSPLAVTQARLTGRKLAQSVAALEAESARQIQAVKTLIGLDPEAKISLTGEISAPESLPASPVDMPTILGGRPDHVLALKKIDEADATLTFEQAKRWEDVSMKLFIEREKAVDAPDGLETNTFAGVGISIPLPIRDRNQEGIEHAQIDREVAEKTVEASQFKIRSEIETALENREAAWKLARDAGGEILELAEKNLTDFRKAYQQGQADLIQVQQAQEQVLELRSAAIDFVADYALAEAALREALGDYNIGDVNEQK